MSNVTTGEIVNLVAAAYGIEPAAILKQPHGVQVSATGREARALVFFLGAKHTPWTPRTILHHLGLSDCSSLLHRMAVAGEAITARLPHDPAFAALVEGVEQGIDRIHESRDHQRLVYQTAAKKRATASMKVRPLSQIKEGEATPEWWASNDARFRAALLDAAE